MHRASPKYKNSAAFYDVDGTLIKTNIVHAFAYYAGAPSPSLIGSAVDTVKTARVGAGVLGCRQTIA